MEQGGKGEKELEKEEEKRVEMTSEEVVIGDACCLTSHAGVYLSSTTYFFGSDTLKG